MPKLPDNVDDWKAPWETETGENEIEKPKLKRYLFGVLKDKEKAQEARTVAETERDEAKKQAASKAQEGETEVDKLKREKKELEEKLKSGAGDGKFDLERLKLEVALEKGLKKGDVKRLIGNTEAELLADADELLKSFGQGGETDNGDGANDGNDARRTPRGRNNPGDPDPEAGAEVSLEKALDSIPRVR